MTREEREKAIDLLDNLRGMVEDNQGNDYDFALKMGIEALNILKQLETDLDFERKWLSDAGYNARNVDIVFKSLRYTLKNGGKING